MRSHSFLRAGLVALTFVLCALFASAAPIELPTLQSLSPPRNHNCIKHPAACIIDRRELDVEERSLDINSRSLTPPGFHLTIRKDIDHPATHVPRGIFDAIGNAFKNVGEGIKNVAQKVGNGVKTAVNKVANGAKTVVKKAADTAKKVVKKAGNVAKTVAKKVVNGAKTVAKKVANGAKKVVNGAKKVAQKVANGAKNVAKKVADGSKNAANKVADVAKKDGPMAGKFGLKILSTAQSVASKGVKFIPGVGTAASLALKAGSMGTDIASNAIQAKLPDNMQQGMNIMDKIEHPLSGTAGAVLDAIPRDIDEADLELLSREDFDWEPEIREWNEWEQRDWEQWGTRGWEYDNEM
ncbi:hypothetical protein BDQ17DRAFT_1429928 [Cyathus striatus]|nr:hypothetical protein BDQ17DRAFT_1429928 [Cyathus striatus]